MEPDFTGLRAVATDLAILEVYQAKIFFSKISLAA
jgi:hypothetical protein